MLRLTGRLADGWFPSFGYAGPDAIPEMRRRLDDAAVRAGREPGDVRRIYNLSGDITDGDERGLLQGPPSHWVQALAGFRRELGFDDFVFGPGGDDPARQIELFAAEVVPGVRQALGEEA
jgi:alkanesulfonate monooxygenase SsuD/methylene tetrahydromethanopterin reductase-like flavin-dependent oxidoreductase (luciferase family)